MVGGVLFERFLLEGRKLEIFWFIIGDVELDGGNYRRFLVYFGILFYCLFYFFVVLKSFISFRKYDG